MQIKVAAYTKGRDTPSARFRVRELIPLLEKNDVLVREYPNLFSRYPVKSSIIKSLMGVASLCKRIPDIIAGYGHDISLLQREMISTLTTLEPLVKRPIVMDVDDAIFLRGNGKAARRLANMSQVVMCGNEFLAEHFSQWNKAIRIIPTGIDTERYTPAREGANKDKVIGWVGTRTNFQYLYQIAPALEKIVRQDSKIKIRIVSDSAPDFSGKLKEQLEFIPWSYARDVTEIQNMTVGIMPLADTDWERGKCSFKMLQYMACGLPVVVSPVGMNKDVLEKGTIGFGADTQGDWIDSIMQLLDDESLAEKMGKNGRQVVEENFSLDKVATDVSLVFRDVIT